MKRLCIAFAAAVAVGCAVAETVYWTKINAASGTDDDAQWGIPGNWTDESGAPLSVAPTNGTHDIKIPALPSNHDGSRREINTGALSGNDGNVYITYPAVNPSIVSIGASNDVYDTWLWTVNIADRVNGNRHTPFVRFFSVADPNGFEGCWTTDDSKSTLELRAAADFVPTLHSLDATCRPYIRVPDSGTAGAIASMSKPGTVSKDGDGELRVATTLGEDSRFTVEKGTLTLEGGDADAEVAALLKTAALHLDATRSDTFKTEKKITDGEEYTIVKEWHDVNGNGNYAYHETYSSSSVYFYPYSHGAFISPATSPTGLPLVDFGSHCKDEGRFGPSNCWLRLSSAVKDPLEVFYAVQTPGGTGGCTILGSHDESGLAFLVERGSTKLFCDYSAGSIGRNGDIMINGRSVPFAETKNYTSSTLTNVSVISIAVRPGAKVGLLGSDRHYVSRSGGSRLGEVLLFTNQLTRAQRVRISRYLTRRWVTGEAEELDADAVIMKTSDGGIGVGNGRKARVGVVKASGKRLRKTGGGMLEVGLLEPQDAVVEIEDGAVSFAAGQEPAVGAPAENPYIWLDANKTATLVQKEFDGSDNVYVSEWKDCRADCEVKALAISNAPPRMPYLVSDIGNGRGAGVSLGKKGNTTQSWFALPTWGKDGIYGSGNPVTGDTYAGFIVLRMNELNNPNNIFGSSTMQMMRASYIYLLASKYCDSKSPSAFWSINGVPVDPWEDVSVKINQTNDVVLVSFRSLSPLTVNAITKDRKNMQHPSAGGMTIGEFITYHRKLSREEFIATEAYLLEKWLGVEHPVRRSAATSMTFAFADEAAMRLHGENDLSLKAARGGDGNLVKTGSGSVATEVPVDPGSVSESISVEDGGFEADISIAGRAYFHFDASRPETLDTYAGEDGKTYVKSWHDLSTNGLFACSTKYHPTSPYPKFVISDPTLKAVEMPDGQTRNVIDFGAVCNTSWTEDKKPGDSASVYFSRSFAGAIAVQEKVREIYIIQTSSDNNAHFIGHYKGDATKPENGSLYFQRGGTGIFYPTYTSSRIQDGYIALDRTPRAVSYALPKNTWCLVSVGATDSVIVDSFMHDRNCNAGGGSIAEVIAFDFALTPTQRAALEQRLMRKWGIGNELPPLVESKSVFVSDGASLAVGDNTLKTSALGGGGTLSAAGVAVADGGTLSFSYRSKDDVDAFHVDGAFRLEGSCTVKVDVKDISAVGEGVYTLLSATGGIEGSDLDRLVLSADFGRRWKAHLFLRGGSLCLRVIPKGFSLIVR